MNAITNARLEILDVEQGTEEWYQVRSGIITASEFGTVMAKGRGGSESLTRSKYLCRLVGERMSGQFDKFDSYTNSNMTRGKEWEPEVRDRHTLAINEEVKVCGFLRRGDIGCSPDGLIGDKGLAEYKTAIYSKHIYTMKQDQVPAEHVPQVQGGLWVSGREWCDFVSFSPGLPLFRKRVYRDENYIAMMKAEVDRFYTEMMVLLADLKRRYA